MPEPPKLRRILISAVVALSLGLAVASLLAGYNNSVPLRLLQGLAAFVGGAALLVAVTVLVMIRLAGWRDPESEEDFERLVQRSEMLAAGELSDFEDDEEDDELDEEDENFARSPVRAQPQREERFQALVRAAIEELPFQFHLALEHVAIVVSDDGELHHAYGLYQGDTVARDHFHDHILIFRDTLMRDFGHDEELLAEQVRRTLRHELAHHLGWDEKGVRGLGL